MKARVFCHSIKNIHGVLHRSLEQACKLGFLESNPSDSVVLPRMEHKQVYSMDESELKAFLAAIKDHPYEHIMFVTVFTGMRQGEVLGLTWDCVGRFKTIWAMPQQASPWEHMHTRQWV